MAKTPIKNDQPTLRDICKELENSRKDNKSADREAQIEALHSLIITISNFSKYIFTIVTLLIPIIFSLVTNNDIKNHLDQRDSVLIIGSLIFLFVSFLLGLTNMVFEIIFYRKWLKNQNKKLQLWSSTTFWPADTRPEKVQGYIKEHNSLVKMANEIEESLEKESSFIFLIGQVVFLIIGIIPIIIIIFRQLP